MTSSAICYIGMGSPESPGNILSVRSFLFNIFSDRHILPYPKIMRLGLAYIISRRRAASSMAKYNLIGGNSPYTIQTISQTEAIASELEKLDVHIPVLTAFSYSEPSIKTIVKQLAYQDINNIIGLPQYPQYSTTTTASCIDTMRAETKKQRIKFVPVYAYPVLNGLIQSWKEAIIDCIPEDSNREKMHLLFVAHSIPFRCLEQKDPYPTHVRKTVTSIVKSLDMDISWSIAFQSPATMGKWLEPGAESAVVHHIHAGKRILIVVPISFLTENLETLYDLDSCLSLLTRKIGEGEVQFIRVPVPFLSKPLVKSLAQVAKKILEKEDAC